jgi:hypothetical protein
MRVAILMILLAAPLMAQLPTTPPAPLPASSDKESFVIQPGSVDKGAQNVAIRLVANVDGAFASSSSKQPNLTFSAGVTMAAGTFQVLNQNEVQCIINVQESAVGTCEVRLDLFSVNGTTILRTLRGTLGIKGETAVTGSQAKAGAESVKLVQVNVSKPQAAGALLISGGIAGTVVITAPTGTNFSELPIANSTSGDINSPKLENTNTVFSFSIGNVSLAQVTVRVDNIKYNTQLFGLAGGTEGDLAVEISGAALSNQAALVVNAFTAKLPIEGSNDNTTQPENTGSEQSPSTDPNSPASTSPPARITNETRPLDSDRRERPRRDRDRGNPGGATPSTAGPTTPPAPPPRPNQAFPNQPGDNRGAPGPGVGLGGGGAKPVGGAGSSTTGGMGSAEPGSTREKGTGTLTGEPAAKELQVTPGLYFCDKDFKPITALVLDKAVSDEAGGRVWVMLKLAKDKQPDRVETVTVKLTLNGVSRELTLTETGKNTGLFRCAKEGVLVVADQNPNSNTTETTAEPPKPRYPR